MHRTTSDIYRGDATLLEAEYQESSATNTPDEHWHQADIIVGKLIGMIRDLADGLDSVRLARVHRPNGKLYRATKPAQAILLGEDAEDGIAVLRTHDVAVALSVARLEHTLPDDAPHELVWWNSHLRSREDSYRVFYSDETHGFPAVVFHA